MSHCTRRSRFSLLGGVELKNTPVMECWIAAGFTESRRFYEMRIDFNGPPEPAEVPDGLVLRRIAPDEERSVFGAMQEAFEDHFGYMKPASLENAFTRWKHYFLDDPDYDPGLQIVAVDADSLTNATRLYEKCGMRQHKVFVQIEKMLRDGEELANVGG
ncbi:MAG: hypothetical protein KAU31_16660 [Spirochaetaceae bacterium]|nr:hypothetical protein [Spirochaetaceae bacterium]